MAAEMLSLVGSRKVRVSRAGVAAFNRSWPCSPLRDSRAYWFEFDESGELVDSDVPRQDDGPAALALCEDCRAWFMGDTVAAWVGE